uniref:Chemosensory protein n=1 Tax=Anoplophora chinensis TaxID=217632 RepID=A0A2H4ZB64_ANOCN|nr:chemosensory protein [Anoplophora chinensis]
MHLTLIFVFTLVAGALSEEYTSKYDNIDLDAIMKNERLLKNYIDCLLDRGKCSNDANELKKHIPEALETECAKCSERHKGGVRRVIKFLAENRKEWWNELVQKYDPDGTYRKKYQDLSKKEHVSM